MKPRGLMPRGRLMAVLGGGSFPSALKSGLVLALNMEELSGTRYDASGQGNNATETGAVTYGVGVVGIAAKSANSATSYLTLTAPLSIPVDADFEASVWISMASLDGLWRDALCVGDTLSDAYGWRLINNGSTHKWYFATTGGKLANSNVAIADANFHNVHFWFDKTNTRIGISVDGEEAVLTTGVTSITDTGYPCNIFRPTKATMGNGLIANSMIDRFYLWNRVLSTSERALDYKNGTPMQLPI